MRKGGDEPQTTVLASLAHRLSYLRGDFTDPVTYTDLGHDLASTRSLNDELHQLIDDDQIRRIDHFLGEQPVLDIQFLRFANVMLEPVWNRDHVAAVQLSLAEDFGVEDRGPSYDSVGTLRDVVKNYLWQVLSMIAMEPPVGPGPTVLWDKKLKFVQAVAEVDSAPVRARPVRRIPQRALSGGPF